MSDHNIVCEGDTFADLAREFLQESDESARAYLLQRWLAATMGTLREARRQAGLTQAEVAQRLGTTQSAIARLERDHAGGCSLRRYIEYLAACDLLPLDIEVTPAASLRAYALANPDAPRSSGAIQNWRDRMAGATEAKDNGQQEAGVTEAETADAYPSQQTQQFAIAHVAR